MRRHIEAQDAVALVKRLLGLAYFWSGAENAVQLQLYATWILYAVLPDLSTLAHVLRCNAACGCAPEARRHARPPPSSGVGQHRGGQSAGSGLIPLRRL